MAIDQSALAHLEPIAMLSASRQQELTGLCYIEKVSKDIDPFRMNVLKNAQAMYLLSGDLGLLFANGIKKILRGGSEAARQAIDAQQLALQDAIALTEIEIVRIDLDLLDIMMTWDQLAASEIDGTQDAAGGVAGQKHGTAGWMRETSVFSAAKLQTGVFSRLPPANIEEMFRRMTVFPVKAGQVIITQGTEGDYYYLLEKGIALVTRSANTGGPPSLLAELMAGDAFGEEALASDNKRNATVTMKTEGTLLRLNKTDFIELLKAPLINQVAMSKAQQKIKAGAMWLDVRFPSEYKFDHLPDALNTPLNEIRDLIKTLDKGKQYIVYCQTGRRSSAAAFIMVQNGFKVFVLEGGTKAQAR